MNPSNYGTWNLENPRRIFLMSVSVFLMGDILGILNAMLPFIWIVFGVFLFVAFTMKSKYFVLFMILLASWIWYTVWKYSYENHRESVYLTEKITNWFQSSGKISGRIEKLMYRKERSVVYLFYIDNFDNFDKKTNNAVPERYIHVDQPKNMWSKGKNAIPSLFIEVPSNLVLHKWDRIVFSWKIRQNIHFPLKWYDRYAFFHWWNGHIFITSFTFTHQEEPTFRDILQSHWERVFTTSFPRDVAWITLGMTIGSTRYLSESVKESFLQSGITHILVVSGSNIAFVILFLSFFLKFISHHSWVWRIIILSGIIFYVGIVGFEVPVIRAAIMWILSYMIVSAWWKASGKALVGLTLVILTLIEPLSPLYDAGYGLSFGATLGIILFQKYSKNIFSHMKIPEIIGSALALTLWASLWSLPILIFHFWSIAINSILTNILIAWFVGWILLSGSIFWILTLLWIPFLKMVWLLVYIPTKIVIILSQFLSNGISLTFSESSQIWISSFIVWIMLYYFIFDEEYS